jgi:hypothetical protein
LVFDFSEAENPFPYFVVSRTFANPKKLRKNTIEVFHQEKDYGQTNHARRSTEAKRA